MTFESLGLCEPVLRALGNEGYTTPTPIQAQSIPHVISGKDVLGCAQTGTGKTAAFALPILHRLDASGPASETRTPIRVLVLSPTRELAAQISESFRTYGRHLRFRHAEVYGGVSQGPQTRALKQGVDVLIATPGRLLDLIEQGYIELGSVETLVLDEADRMLDMGFIPAIRQVVKLLPTKRQTLMFSATMPANIRKLADAILRNPVEVSVTPVASTAELIQQSVIHVSKTDKPSLLRHLVQNTSMTRALVFTRTKHGADRVTKSLCRAGIRAEAIHGNKTQSARQRALLNFKENRLHVLVATDVAARGIDVDEISHVVNYDLPNEPETYVHRIGRTGRAGASGQAIAFCDPAERSFLRAIERLTRREMTVNTEHKDFERIAELADHSVDTPRQRRPMTPKGGSGAGGGGNAGGFRSGPRPSTPNSYASQRGRRPRGSTRSS